MTQSCTEVAREVAQRRAAARQGCHIFAGGASDQGGLGWLARFVGLCHPDDYHAEPDWDPLAGHCNTCNKAGSVVSLHVGLGFVSSASPIVAPLITLNPSIQSLRLHRYQAEVLGTLPPPQSHVRLMKPVLTWEYPRNVVALRHGWLTAAARAVFVSRPAWSSTLLDLHRLLIQQCGVTLALTFLLSGACCRLSTTCPSHPLRRALSWLPVTTTPQVRHLPLCGLQASCLGLLLPLIVSASKGSRLISHRAAPACLPPVYLQLHHKKNPAAWQRAQAEPCFVACTRWARFQEKLARHVFSS